MTFHDQVVRSFNSLMEYVEVNEYKGWDPYDGLNSKIFQATPLKYSSLARLAWIQLFKRSPVNLRPILKVEKEYNAKGLGLLLSAYTNLNSICQSSEIQEKIKTLANIIISLKSNGYSGSCWGYNFDWQARAFFQPKNTPTVVATTYVAYSLLDAFEATGDSTYFDEARSACDFVLNDLNRTYDKEGDFCFSYSPLDKTTIFNASLLGSRLLSRVYAFTKEPTLINEAKKSIAFCCKAQHHEGSWFYGTLPFHQWIDNFHTGFNLECISEYQSYSKDFSFEPNLARGITYYLATFFTRNGEAKYYSNALFPIDIHAPAQLIVTLYRIGQLPKEKELADRVLRWTMENMQDTQGFFYYQIKKKFNSKIPYMRWAQAWMFFAFTIYLKTFKQDDAAN